MRIFSLSIYCFVFLAVSLPSFARIILPGQYAGIPIFDRWDGCILYSGANLLYVSEKTKEGLRAYAGKPVLIDVNEIQEILTIGLIGGFTYLGPPKEPGYLKLDDLQLTSSIFENRFGKPMAALMVTNLGKQTIPVATDQLAPTLLMKKFMELSWEPTDGPSFAVISGNYLYFPLPAGPEEEAKDLQPFKPFKWDIALRDVYSLAPGEKQEFIISLDLPDGEYDFLFGYGGGVHAERGLASNRTGFNVVNGKLDAVLLEVKIKDIPPLRTGIK